MDLEEKIKSENRQTTINNLKEKLLYPAKRVYNKMLEYLEDKSKDRNAERRFQEKWQKRYDEYMNAFYEHNIGDYVVRDVKHKYPNDEVFCDEYVSDHGSIIRTIIESPSAGIRLSSGIVTKYEGYVQDEKGRWVYACSERLNNGWSKIYAREIIRKPNGKFVERVYQGYYDGEPTIYNAQVQRFKKFQKEQLNSPFK